jgi:hypothetical protein
MRYDSESPAIVGGVAQSYPLTTGRVSAARPCAEPKIVTEGCAEIPLAMVARSSLLPAAAAARLRYGLNFP